MRDPYQLAHDFLTNVVTEMTTLGSALPTTQYVAPGSVVAYDGEQVTSNILRIFASSGAPGMEDQGNYAQFVVMAVELQLVIVRNTPMEQDGIGGMPVAPNPLDIQKSAQLMLSDVQNLTQALVNIRAKNSLGTQGMMVHVGPVTTEGPEGGVVATVGRFIMPLL